MKPYTITFVDSETGKPIDYGMAEDYMTCGGCDLYNEDYIEQCQLHGLEVLENDCCDCWDGMQQGEESDEHR